MNIKTKLILYRILLALAVAGLLILSVDRWNTGRRTGTETGTVEETGTVSTSDAEGSTEQKTGPDADASDTFTDERKPDYDIIPTLVNDPETFEFTWTSYEGLYYATISYSIDEKLYEYYRELPRYFGDNEYLNYITDPMNEEYLEMLVENINEIGDTRGYSEGERVREAITFVQNFPYVSDAEESTKADWPKYPIETLYEREGDCEDTSILLAGILSKMGYGTCLIKYADHMAVGLKGDDTLTGSYYTYEDKNYYYIETTNTGWDIGEMPEEYDGIPATLIVVN